MVESVQEDKVTNQSHFKEKQFGWYIIYSQCQTVINAGEKNNSTDFYTHG